MTCWQKNVNENNVNNIILWYYEYMWHDINDSLKNWKE
jgi:hypothetical protein